MYRNMKYRSDGRKGGTMETGIRVLRVPALHLMHYEHIFVKCTIPDSNLFSKYLKGTGKISETKKCLLIHPKQTVKTIKIF